MINPIKTIAAIMHRVITKVLGERLKRSVKIWTKQKTHLHQQILSLGRQRNSFVRTILPEPAVAIFGPVCHSSQVFPRCALFSPFWNVNAYSLPFYVGSLGSAFSL